MRHPTASSRFRSSRRRDCTQQVRPRALRRRWGRNEGDIVAITAAMLRSTGLAPFTQHYQDRVFDVGIAEQHAAAPAAGLATGGLHPVAAAYAAFLSRPFDQVLMDVALHRCGDMFVLDRAGITGDDGCLPQRHVGPGDPAGRAQASDRGATRGRGAAATAARGCGGGRRTDRGALPQGGTRSAPADDGADRRDGRAPRLQRRR